MPAALDGGPSYPGKDPTMASKKKTKDPEHTTVTFPGLAGETTLPIYPGMSAALPPMWQIRFEDTRQAFIRGDYGDSEFAIRLAMIYTHLPDVPGNQRLDPRMLDRLPLSDEAVVGLVQAGVAIMGALYTDAEAVEEGESGNA